MPDPRPGPAAPAAGAHAVQRPPLGRSIVLVGLMGAGKTAVGSRLARVLGLPFVDADDEIERAAGMSIADIFEAYGEPTFRDLERRVVARLLDPPARVVALGGGAFVDPVTRARVRERAISVWLRCDLDMLVARTGRRRGIRPLLAKGDVRATLERLQKERAPAYAEADLAVDSGGQSIETAVAQIVALLEAAS
jgi:shikimate kinase